MANCELGGAKVCGPSFPSWEYCPVVAELRFALKVGARLCTKTAAGSELELEPPLASDPLPPPSR